MKKTITNNQKKTYEKIAEDATVESYTLIILRYNFYLNISIFCT